MSKSLFSGFLVGIAFGCFVCCHKNKIRLFVSRLLKNYCHRLYQKYIIFDPKKSNKNSTPFEAEKICGVIKNGIVGLVGNTPMLFLESLSLETGCYVLAKLEYRNPGGSSKDRFAVRLLEDLPLQRPMVKTIYEGTSGSTGISLALFATLKGYACHIYAPSHMSSEKCNLIKLFGATLIQTKSASIVDPSMYINIAQKKAHEDESSLFADQFGIKSALYLFAV